MKAVSTTFRMMEMHMCRMCLRRCANFFDVLSVIQE